jgi:hypothetical protein
MVRCTVACYLVANHTDAFAKVTIKEFLEAYPGVKWLMSEARLLALKLLPMKKQEKDRIQMTSLENKIGFAMPCMAVRKHPECNGVGRGGAGKGNFVFTLLDWRNTAAYDRRHFVLNNGGGEAQRVTRTHFQARVRAVGQRTIDQWLNNHNLLEEVREEIREIRNGMD